MTEQKKPKKSEPEKFAKTSIASEIRNIKMHVSLNQRLKQSGIRVVTCAAVKKEK